MAATAATTVAKLHPCVLFLCSCTTAPLFLRAVMYLACASATRVFSLHIHDSKLVDV